MVSTAFSYMQQAVSKHPVASNTVAVRSTASSHVTPSSARRNFAALMRDATHNPGEIQAERPPITGSDGSVQAKDNVSIDAPLSPEEASAMIQNFPSLEPLLAQAGVSDAEQTALMEKLHLIMVEDASFSLSDLFSSILPPSALNDATLSITPGLIHPSPAVQPWDNEEAIVSLLPVSPETNPNASLIPEKSDTSPMHPLLHWLNNTLANTHLTEQETQPNDAQNIGNLSGITPQFVTETAIADGLVIPPEDQDFAQNAQNPSDTASPVYLLIPTANPAVLTTSVITNAQEESSLPITIAAVSVAPEKPKPTATQADPTHPEVDSPKDLPDLTLPRVSAPQNTPPTPAPAPHAPEWIAITDQESSKQADTADSVALPTATPAPVVDHVRTTTPVAPHLPPVHTPHPLPSEQVQLAITRAAKEGIDTLTIQLEPLDLGRVEVNMRIERNGETKLWFVIDKPETFDALSRDARSLERALQDSGLKTDSGSMQFNMRQQNQPDPGNGQPREQNNTPLMPRDEPKASVIAPQTRYYQLNVQEGLDIHA